MKLESKTKKMNQSELFTKAHQIVKFKDEEKIGNRIFRFLKNMKYATRLSAALKYLYKIKKTGSYGGQIISKNDPTMKQWDFLQRNRVDAGADYRDFCKKYTRKTASDLIGAVIRHKEDGYTWAYQA